MLKLSEEEIRLSKSEVYLVFVKKRSRLSWSLISGLVGLVFTFCFITVFVPSLTNTPIIQGNLVSLGITFGLSIIVLITGAAVYFVKWNNNELARMIKTVRAQREE